MERKVRGWFLGADQKLPVLLPALLFAFVFASLINSFDSNRVSVHPQEKSHFFSVAKMNQEQVRKQIENMKAFIMKEAQEKRDEILAKADEEFSMEKARLLQAERMKITKDYERKEKQLETNKKMYVDSHCPPPAAPSNFNY